MTSHKKFNFRFSLALVLVALLIQATPAFAGGNASAGVLPPDSKIYGHTYAEWSNAWWQWAFSIPVPTNPLLDATGANCGVGQSGKVFFLAGAASSGTTERICTVPANKALFFPILNFEDDILWWDTPAQVTQSCNTYLKGIDAVKDTMSASLDGVAIKDLPNYRLGENGPTFKLTLPANNLEAYYSGGTINPSAGKYGPACSVGYYLMLSPLEPGDHTLHFAGGAADGFHLDVIYHLTIKGNPEKD